ncbi:MAG TPA: hypothetical protein VE083_12700 [Terriglobales bacterium]|nr:hypothetical protein [Terriglobales bacterium]
MRVHAVAMVVVIFSALALGQTGVRGAAGYCSYGCGPFIPLVTTPSVSFQTVSSSPAGATDATGGLQAGARNSTLSMISGNTDAVHTEVVWYSGGGSPLVSPAVRLPHAEAMGRMGMQGGPEHMEHGHGEEARNHWTYYAGREQAGSPVEAAAIAKGAKKASRTYTNQDVERVSQKSEDFKKK